MPLICEAFIQRMQAELEANAHKGSWEDWQPQAGPLMDEIQHHVRKLELALAAVLMAKTKPMALSINRERLEDSQDKVREYAADLGNLAMKAFEVHGGETPTAEPPAAKTPEP